MKRENHLTHKLGGSLILQRPTYPNTTQKGSINMVLTLPEKQTEYITQWIRDWFFQNGPKANAVIGISGGKDSTIAAALLAKALGPNRVTGVLMPNGVQKDIDDAKQRC